jgi:prepilin-type N-terminal cleavage/methylation domain-containing protein
MKRHLDRDVRSRAGFTLVELVIALVVFGVLATIASPRLNAFYDRNQVDSALNGLTGDVAYARMLAVRSAQRVTLSITASDYTVVINDVNGDRTAKQVPVANDFRGLTLSPATITLNSRGLIEGAGGPLVLTASRGKQSGSVTILPTGRAYREY